MAALRVLVLAERLPDEVELRAVRPVADALLVAGELLLEDELLVGDEALPAGALLAAAEPFPADELPVRDARALADVLVRAALPGEPPGPDDSPGSERAPDAARSFYFQAQAQARAPACAPPAVATSLARLVRLASRQPEDAPPEPCTKWRSAELLPAPPDALHPPSRTVRGSKKLPAHAAPERSLEECGDRAPRLTPGAWAAPPLHRDLRCS